MHALDRSYSDQQRADLVAYCLRLTHDRDVAEDLAQETWLVALRQADAGRVVTDWSTWIYGIARRLARARFAESCRYQESLLPKQTLAGSADDPLDALLDGERGELLDHALGLLEPTARTLLVGRYLEDIPTAELSQRLAITENALYARLHRARQELQRILSTRLVEHARIHGLISESASPGETKTPIRCPRCGVHRLSGTLTRTDFALRCPSCDAPGSPLAGFGTRVAPLPAAKILAGAQGFRVAQRRVNDWWQTFLSDALRTGTARCTACMATATVAPQHPLGTPGLTLLCPRCTAPFFIAPTGLLFHTPAAQTFWRDHGRILPQPTERIQFAGRDALRASFCARDSRVRLEGIFDAATMNLLHLEKTC